MSTKIPLPKMYVTEAELIELGILKSRRTAGRAVKRGELPLGTRRGQDIVFKLADVIAHIDARKGQTAFASGKTTAGKRSKTIKRGAR